VTAEGPLAANRGEADCPEPADQGVVGHLPVNSAKSTLASYGIVGVDEPPWPPSAASSTYQRPMWIGFQRIREVYMARQRATSAQAIVDAAAKACERKGYGDATIGNIAVEAGVSKPTVYQYVEST